MRESLPTIRKQRTANTRLPTPSAVGYGGQGEHQSRAEKAFRFFVGRRGFTLIELLVVTAIIAILLIVALASYRTFGHQTDLDTTAQRILSTLQLARSQTVASEDESVYGVHFEASKYVLFKGTTYDSTSTDNKEYTLDRTRISDTQLGGGSEVVFDRVRGTTSQSGYITAQLINEPARTKTIIINPLGQVSLEETVNPTGARRADTRHLHFDLGWSIQTAGTLRFVFGDPLNPDLTENIAMASYFNADKTEFYWEGTIKVNGTDQVLQVHTHYLDATNAILSIQRDLRYNDKAVQVLIDDKEIVSYTADGDATVGAFGGVMTQR